jgi:hypothetical protein
MAANWEAHFSKGTTGARPAANTLPQGAIYWSTDDKKFYVGSGPGNTWADFTAAIMLASGGTFTGDVSVPDEAYDTTAWNGSLEVPTKNAIRDKIETLTGGSAAAKACRLRHSTTQSINDATATVLAFDTEVYDTDTMHSGGANTRITIATAGVYAITASSEWASAANAYTNISIRKNGANAIATQAAEVDSISPINSVATQDQAIVGDYYEVTVYQNTGSPKNVTNTADYSPVFCAALLGT